MTDRHLRVVLAEDSVILREGMVELLTARGCEVVAATGTAEGLSAAVGEHRPDVAVVDVRMPPHHTDEGIDAAVEIRSAWPGVGVLVFSQHVETAWAVRLMAAGAAGAGYLLKERVARTSGFVDALHRVAEGGTALDPERNGPPVGRGLRRVRPLPAAVTDGGDPGARRRAGHEQMPHGDRRPAGTTSGPGGAVRLDCAEHRHVPSGTLNAGRRCGHRPTRHVRSRAPGR
ncbi:response regulator transcription factor [Streptomyces roseolus]|uniref:response regulator n=2 Tax=Streptomyces TaxID=1883 RepID=UPI00365F464B